MHRIITPALGALAVLFTVSFGLSYGLLELANTSSACAELAMLLCGAILIPFAILIGVIIEIAAAHSLLKRRSVPHSIAIPILTTVGFFIFCYAIIRFFADLTLFYVVAGVLFLAMFITSERYLNRVSGKFDSKILRSIIALGAVAIIGTLFNFFVIR